MIMISTQNPITTILALVMLSGLLASCTDDSPWQPAGEFGQGRGRHSATLLTNDEVLFVGGMGKRLLPTTELQDSVSGRWEIGADLVTARENHTATKLENGHVVIIGGTGWNGPLANVEVYDPATQTFSELASMAEPRTNHTATWVDLDPDKPTGEKIVVVGGQGPAGVSKTFEVFDADTGHWSAATDLLEPRSEHTATLLDAATMLVVGGTNGTDDLATAQRYDASTDTWSDAGVLATARRNHSMTRLDANRAFVAGGRGESGALGTTEVYDATTNTWSLGAALDERRYEHTATRLSDGTVLIVGGEGTNGATATVERYTPARYIRDEDAMAVVPAMSIARMGHSATWLADGSVLVAGGEGDAARTNVTRFVPEDNRTYCERTEECPTVMVCNRVARRCEHASKGLSYESACTYAVNREFSNKGLGIVAMVLAAAFVARPRMRRVTRAALLGGSLLLLPGLAEAQTSTFYLDRLQVGGGPSDGTAVWRPVFGPTRLFAHVGVGWSSRPLRIDGFVADAERARGLYGPAVQLQLTGYGTFGIEVLKRGALAVTLPYVAYQRGYSTENLAVGLDKPVTLASSTLEDIRIDGRMMLLWNEAQTVRVAVRGAFFLPIGDVYSFAGERSAWGNIGLSAEYDAKSFLLTGNSGITVRPTTYFVDMTTGMEWVYAAGAYWTLRQDRFRFGGEVFGSVGLLPNAASSLEVAATSRLAFGEDQSFFIGLSAGAGFGLAPDARFVARIGGVIPMKREPRIPQIPVRSIPEVDSDRDGWLDLDDPCPAVREDNNGVKDGCPEKVIYIDPDLDRDGIPNDQDQCPKGPEDKDGVNDTDGCPEQDADADGFADAIDKCPNDPGVQGKDPKRMGCSEYFEVTSTEVKLFVQVEFNIMSKTVAPASYRILDDLGRLLAKNPNIRRLRIEGHTDDVGEAHFNLTLSTMRAEAVRDYLVQRAKVDPSRLSFIGLGQTRPIASNATEAGRAKNRRVELHIEQ
jgi:OmpA-OmpF porin, OOP family